MSQIALKNIMYCEERVYIKAISRKTKKIQEKKVQIDLDEDNYGLTDFEINSDEFQNLSEEFSGKCFLQSVDQTEDDSMMLKKNKAGENQFSSLNNLIQQETVPFEKKIIKKQQSQEKQEKQEEEINSTSETISNLSQCYDLDNDYYSIPQQGEIDYLQGLKSFLKAEEQMKQRNLYCSKKQQNKKTKQEIIPQIQQKKIVKINRIG